MVGGAEKALQGQHTQWDFSTGHRAVPERIVSSPMHPEADGRFPSRQTPGARRAVLGQQSSLGFVNTLVTTIGHQQTDFQRPILHLSISFDSQVNMI